jgi:D-beta-D-heptose 7-phosphate kinase/D-beta-D-heptose 1-phosphate adenosyltransferase
MKVLIIGESCTDKFVYGKIDRLSPEAPVPVINPVEVTCNPGMAANTLENCKVLHPDCKLVLWSQEQKITKTRFVEKKSNHMFIRFDEGEESISKFNQDLSSIKYFDLVIVSDYNKGFLSDEDIKNIGLAAKVSIIDSKRILTSDMVSGYTFIKLNEFEKINNKNLQHSGIITTLGSKGAEYKNVVYPSPDPQETIDVSGAGDTFTAAFSLKYMETKNIKIAIEYANTISAYVVSKRGVVIPNETF